MQPLTVNELSLVEGLMSGTFSIPSAKEARVHLKGAMSLSQKKKKRKRQNLLDTWVVDDPEGYKQSKAGVAVIQIGMPVVSASIEPSLAKSAKKARPKSSEAEGL